MLRLLGPLLSLLIASPASAVAMSWTPIGNPGNACATNPSYGCFGGVGYEYAIGTYEVTNAQYVEFLNAKAATDPLGLYRTSMGSGYGGITRSGSSGSYSYAPIAGRENMPVNFVSFFDAMRFTNWMNNGQGNGDTETGAYSLLGPYTTTSQGDAQPNNWLTVTRNPGATIVLPTEDEWYKAAYYSPATTSFFDYPAGSNTQPACTLPTALANHANCASSSDLTATGSYPGSASPYGTFDQGGNVREWEETITATSRRLLRGGDFSHAPIDMAASERINYDFPQFHTDVTGFRLVLAPEPSTGLLVSLGLLLGVAGWRRSRVS
jgi:formylglycine-generating enzyme required for sulfatase activity